MWRTHFCKEFKYKSILNLIFKLIYQNAYAFTQGF